MGWVDESGEGQHEGWVANILADDRVAWGVCSEGVLIEQATPQDLLAGRATYQITRGGELFVVVPWAEVDTWQVRCECGWTGSRQPARDATDEPGYRGCDAHPDVESVFQTEWRAHVAPDTTIAEISGLASQIQALQVELDAAVRLARAAGIAWARIGAAAGLSKQGAQQHWSRTAS